MDIHMTVSLEVPDNRHARLTLHAFDQALASSRHDDIDPLRHGGQQMPNCGAVTRRNDLDRTSWQAGFLQPLFQARMNSLAGTTALGAAAQDDSIARLQTKRSRIGCDVRSALIDDANDPERHSDALDDQA